MYGIKFEKEALLPRERLVSEGAENLSNQELLAIFMRTGSKDKPVSVLSQELLQKVDHLAELRDLSLKELQSLGGIGQVKAVEMKAMIELGRRINQSEYTMTERIVNSGSLAKKLISDFGQKKQEHLIAIYLDTQNRIIQQKTIFIGSVNKSIAEPREILHYAVKLMATSVIVAHNHPSGDVEPSQNDYAFTGNLKESCEMLGLNLLDHIVVGRSTYYSFREKSHLW